MAKIIVLQITDLDNNSHPVCAFNGIIPTIEQIDNALAEYLDPEEFNSEEERKSLAANLATRWSYEMNEMQYDLFHVDLI